MKKLSVKAKLMLQILILLIVCCVILTSTACLSSSNAINSICKTQLTERADDASRLLSNYFKDRSIMVENVSTLNEIKSMNWTIQKPVLVDQCKKIGFEKMGVVGMDGIAHTTLSDSTVNVGSVDYVRAALKGEEGFSNPTVSKVNGSLIMDVYCPIKDDNGTVIGGIIGTLDVTKINTFVQSMKFTDSTSVFVINENGTTIIHKDVNILKSQQNIIALSQKDSSYKSLAQYIEKMKSGSTGYGEYTYKGVDKIIAYTPVNGMKWYIAVTVTKSDLFSSVNSLRTTQIVITLIFLLFGIVDCFIIAKAITKPLSRIKNFAERLSNYDFSTPINDKRTDEFGQTANALNIAQSNIKDLVKIIIDNSEDMSAASEELSAVVEEITSKIEEINKSAAEIATNMEEANSGTEEIVSGTEKVDSSIEQLSEKATKQTNEAESIKVKAIEVKNSGETSFKKINEINIAQEKKIIDALKKAEVVENIMGMADIISGISSQTNLLSLNAAIEAARAGEMGKGFAVVADEVRTLAEQSSDAVVQIQNTIKEVKDAFADLKVSSSEILDFISKDVKNELGKLAETGNDYYNSAEFITDMSNSTNAMLKEVLKLQEEVARVVEQVSHNTKQSSENASIIKSGINEAAIGMEQVSKTAQSQAEMAQKLNETIRKFKI